MHRFFLLNTPLALGQPVDLSPLAHQLSAVLRVSVGARIELLDGQDSAYETAITQLDRKQARGQIVTQRTLRAEPAIALTLYQCSLKADKFEWVLQKGTELGVARFVPVISERSVVRPAAALLKKYDRWETIIREAAEQSGRGRLPELLAPLTWAEATQHAAGLRLLPWEEALNRQPLRQALQALDAAAAPAAVSLCIGPEGGIAPEEAQVAHATGWQLVSLGQRVLRAETAAIASVALVVDFIDALASNTFAGE